jgi:hypothetical protein
MAVDDVAAVAADDDFDVTADLAAAFDAAEETPVADVPAEETAEQTAERARDEKGRFAPKAEDPEPIAAKASAKPVAAAPVAETAEAPIASTEVVKPPPGFSPTAKVVWNKEALDKAEWEAVKRDIAKRNDEVDKGFAKFAEYKPIERFMDMARQSGTTLDKALENYIGIETRLRQDFSAGVTELCRNQGIHPVALANQILARHGASPQQDGTGTIPANQTVPSIDPATAQRIAALENLFQQQQEAGVQTEIQRFASDPKHTFFENVKADMGRLINSGYAESLDDAYDKACWANEEIRNLLIKQQSTVSDPSAKVAAANQARAASKSITGSPVPGAGSKGPNISLEDEIRQLMDASV